MKRKEVDASIVLKLLSQFLGIFGNLDFLILLSQFSILGVDCRNFLVWGLFGIGPDPNSFENLELCKLDWHLT